jgi:hypothetical protein
LINRMGRLHALDLVERIMWEREAEGDHAGALVAANILLPYKFARLSQSDVRVRHSFENKSDVEIAEELTAIEQRLQLASTIEGEPIVAIPDVTDDVSK